MTCVASPPSNGWTAGDSLNFSTMSTDGEAARMFVPRKSVQRSNSSSSLASNSSTSTISATQPQSNGTANGITNGETRHTASNPYRKYKAPARGIMPASQKAEPVATLSDTRSQSVPAQPGQSAASSVSALQNGHQAPQHAAQTQPQTQSNGVGRASHSAAEGSQIMLELQPFNGTFEPKRIYLSPDGTRTRIGRQTNQKTLPTASNGFFDSKVLSRSHAEVWADADGKVKIQDVKSSNGTFVNGQRLSQENRESDPHFLEQGNMLELGIDIVSEDQKTIVHYKVSAKVTHAGPHAPAPPVIAPDYGDLIEPSPVNGPAGQGYRRRPPNQAPNQATGRFGAAAQQGANVQAAPYQAKWLQPVSMEQIVKRINSELKQARSQTDTIDSNHKILHAMQPQHENSVSSSVDKASLIPNKSTDSFKARMASAPPAPPPSLPLPEAPTDAMIQKKLSEMPSIPPMLRRSETEKPKQLSQSANTSPVKPENNSQILSLVEALSNAQNQIATQSQKIKDMEEALHTERENRRDAEERASRLEIARSALPSKPTIESTTDNSTNAFSEKSRELDIDLQHRADAMRNELDEMKILMAQYRQRAEAAESDARQDRQTLSEMVETLERRDQAEIKLFEAEKENTGRDETCKDTLQQHEKAFAQAFERAKQQMRDHKPEHADRAVGIPNGAPKAPISMEDLHHLGSSVLAAALEQSRKEENGGLQQALPQTLANSKRHDQFVSGAPLASALGVVILGMGLMAYLNGWQKVTE